MHWQFGEMEFGEMKRNTSNWSNFGMLLRRAGLTASAGLSCFQTEWNRLPQYFTESSSVNVFKNILDETCEAEVEYRTAKKIPRPSTTSTVQVITCSRYSLQMLQ